MNRCTCPGPEQWRQYAEGRLDQAHHEALDEHLDDCPDCLKAVEALDERGATVFSLLRTPAPPEPTFEGPAFQRLVARAKGLAPATGGEVPAPAAEGDGLEEALARELAARGYALLGPVGAGGMGRVYKGEHRRMKRAVAIKVLAPELRRSTAARARFRREVEAAARLRSPHIVAAHDAGEVAGHDFLVLEYVEGANLAELVRREGPLAVERAVGYVRQAALGLAQAHAAGIVHRDVKPGNLLLDARGTVKVLDLGLARLAEDGPAGADLTTAGVVMGTAAFMAPEQAVDVRRAEARADVYSLGCTLHFLLTGRAPYEAPTPFETLLAHRDWPVPSLRAARPDCPPALDGLFRRMLAKRPEHRPASMEAVARDLEKALRPPAPGPRRRRAAAVAALLVLGAALSWAVLPHPAAPVAPSGRPGAAGPARPTAAPGLALRPAAPAPSEGRARSPLIEMVRIEKGKFLRGSPPADRDGREDERPQKEVRITQPFFLGKYEVTQAQYQEVMGANPSRFGPKGKADAGRHPVESVSWLDAVRFCNKLSERHGLSPFYRIEGTTVTLRAGSTGYRLPTEAEWEYACRAGSTTRWSFGDAAADLGQHAWFADNSGDTTHPVGQKRPNPWGLYDMHGNVPEWCWDRYDRDYYRGDTVVDPAGPGLGATRVFRGGGWDVAARGTRSAARNTVGPAYGVTNHVGLRVARDAGP
jgi:formylglycine-generating enzyme required for sulfatase activity/tRNA A-37 threonylcarbamoyl transferase component Bud32